MVHLLKQACCLVTVGICTKNEGIFIHITLVGKGQMLSSYLTCTCKLDIQQVVGFSPLQSDLFSSSPVLHLLDGCRLELDKVNDKLWRRLKEMMLGKNQRKLKGCGTGSRACLLYMLSVLAFSRSTINLRTMTLQETVM